jgi:CheY-like chemotaxis protein
MSKQLLVVELRNHSSVLAYSSDVSAARSNSQDLSKKTVMICEDDPDLLRVFRLILRSKYNVVGTKSGKECLERYSELKEDGKKIDVLLLDYRLPDTTGDEIAMKLKSLNGTKTILISAFEIDPQVINDLKTKGYITMFVKKPISLDSLLHSLKVTLAS